MKGKGLQYSAFSEADVAKMKEVAQTQVWQPYWADAKAKKGVDAEASFKNYRNLYNKYLAKYN